MTSELVVKECIPCAGGVCPLAGDALDTLAQKVDPAWGVVEGHHLLREFTFADFRQAMNFTTRVGELAEQQNHHPDILLSWGKVQVTIYTHKIDGLTESDFILAAKIDTLGGA